MKNDMFIHIFKKIFTTLPCPFYLDWLFLAVCCYSAYYSGCFVLAGKLLAFQIRLGNCCWAKKCCFQTNLVGAIDLCSVTVINAFRIHSGAVGGCCYFRLAPLVYVCSCACPLLEGLFTSVSSYYKHCVAAGTI